MSVKFEKETIKQTGGIGGVQGISTMRGGKHELADEIGTALTGGIGNAGKPGYLAVRGTSDNAQGGAPEWNSHTDERCIYRHIYSSSRPIHSEPRCSRLDRFQQLKNSWPRGLQKTAIRMATTLHQEFRRWPHTEHS